MKRSLSKLKQTAKLRFPADPAKQAAYIRRVRDAADHLDAHYYWMGRDAWARLKAEIIAEHGERPRLGSAPQSPIPNPQSRPRGLPLGDWAERTIDVVTGGRGKRIAQRVAKAAGKSDCGCGARQAALNRLGARLAGGGPQ